MNELDELGLVRNVAAMKLQQYVKQKVAEGDPLLRLHDADAYAVVDAIAVMVVKTIEHYLAQPMERASNGD